MKIFIFILWVIASNIGLLQICIHQVVVLLAVHNHDTTTTKSGTLPIHMFIITTQETYSITIYSSLHHQAIASFIIVPFLATTIY